MTYLDIARAVRRSTTYVRKVCMLHEDKVQKLQQPMKQSTRKQKKNMDISPWMKKQLSEEQVDFLVSGDTLREWVGLTL